LPFRRETKRNNPKRPRPIFQTPPIALRAGGVIDFPKNRITEKRRRCGDSFFHAKGKKSKKIKKNICYAVVNLPLFPRFTGQQPEKFRSAPP